MAREHPDPAKAPGKKTTEKPPRDTRESPSSNPDGEHEDDIREEVRKVVPEQRK